MKDPITPKSQIVHALRQLWLRSRERAECLKLAKYTCARCGKKKSQKKGFEQKVEVHHKLGVENWDALVGDIRTFLLCEPDKLEALCPECHGEL
jgi:5-methylcytosine-specific restriction endonuclease McrA